MTDIRHTSRPFITEFIEIYRSHPALWKIKSKDYINRNLKNKGYDELVEFYRKVDPQANRDLIAKKIQSLRGSFRKELRKFDQFKRSSASSDDLYVPSLWYFELLLFTREHETSTENLDTLTQSVPSPPIDPDLIDPDPIDIDLHRNRQQQ